MRTLAERIRSARIEAGIDEPAELARRAGVKPAAAYQWESGDIKSLKAETAIALADALNVSVRWLVTGKGKPSAIPEGAPAPADPWVAIEGLRWAQAQLARTLAETIPAAGQAFADHLAKAPDEKPDAAFRASLLGTIRRELSSQSVDALPAPTRKARGSGRRKRPKHRPA